MNPFIRFLLKRTDGMYQRWMTGRGGFVPPDDVEWIRDLPYLDDDLPCHQMDVLLPRKGEGKRPVVVNLHGGGMVLCDRKVNLPFCGELARMGAMVFCLDYPLVPEKTIPQILEDVSRGMDRVGQMLEQLDADPDRVILVGDSAGAFLAVYALAAQKNPDLATAAGIRPTNLKICGLGLVSGMFHTAQADETGLFLRRDFYGPNWRRHPMRPYWKPEVPAVSGMMEPVYLVTSRADKLRPSTLRFHRGLQSAGVPCRMMDVAWNPKYGHDFVIMNPTSPQSQKAMEAMMDFLLGKTRH